MIQVPVLLPDNVDPSNEEAVSEFLASVELKPVTRAKLAQLSDVDLIDAVGTTRKHAKALEAFDNAAKVVLDTRFGSHGSPLAPYEVPAKHFRMVMSVRQRTTLDTARIKEEMGEGWCTEHSKITEYKEFRFPVQEEAEEGYK